MEVKSSIHLSLPSDLLKLFNEYSQISGFSRNKIVIELIESWIEDQQDIVLAKQAMAEINNGTDNLISHEEMMKKLDWNK